MPLSQVVQASHGHLVHWVQRRTPPPTAPLLKFAEDGTTLVRNELGLAQGGIQLSQVTVPTAVNTGRNGGETFCILFGTYVPFDAAKHGQLNPSRDQYVGRVALTDEGNVRAGYIPPADAAHNLREAVQQPLGPAPTATPAPTVTTHPAP